MPFFIFLLFSLVCIEAFMPQKSTLLSAAFESEPSNESQDKDEKTRKRKRNHHTIKLAPRKKLKKEDSISIRTRKQIKEKENESSLFNFDSSVKQDVVNASSSSKKKEGKEKKDSRKKYSYTPSTTTFLSPLESNVIQTLDAIFKQKTEGTIYVNSFFFTHPELAYTLADIKKKHPAIKIVLLIDKLSRFHIKKVLPIFIDAQIPVYSFESTEAELNHCKFIAWHYKTDYGKNVYRALSGSANLTLLGMEEKANFEHMTIRKISKSEFNQFAAITRDAIKDSILLNAGKVDNHFLYIEYPPLKENPQKVTPKKSKELYFSPIDDIQSLIIERINNTHSGSIWLVTYAFDLPPITKALLDALDRGVVIEIIVDLYGLRRKNSQESTPDQLKELQQKGASVFVYQDKGIKKNHGKLILIEDGERIICCQGSYNLTPTSKNSFNNFEILGRKDSIKILKQFKEEIRPSFEHKISPFDPNTNYNSALKKLFQN
jgi:hypothetical protein